MLNLDPRHRDSNHPDGGRSLGLDIILKGHHRQIITNTSFLSETKHLLTGSSFESLMRQFPMAAPC